MINKLTAHSDNSLNILRLVAFSALGYYLYKVQKKQGNLAGFDGSQPSVAPSPERIIDTVLPWLNMSPLHKQILSSIAKETLRGYRKEKEGSDK